MKFVFWQNIISIHQSAFLNALSEHHELTLVVEKDLDEERKEQGWSIPGLERIKVVIVPKDDELYQLLDMSAIHVFSGISAYPMIKKAFKYAVEKGLKNGVLLEPYNWKGLKGKFRWIKYYLLRMRFGNKIDFIAATGELGVTQYSKIGFDGSKIFEWAYFVESTEKSISQPARSEEKNKPSILYVGSIDTRKNIIPQIDIIMKFENQISKMTIVGDGQLIEDLLDKIQGHPVYDYKGNVPNHKVTELMEQHDILVLPSLFDGWGAVVNEALNAGMRVITSENCGAAALLDGETRGEKFDFTGERDFETVLMKWINKGALTPDERQEIAAWAKDHISGKVAADYFERIVNYIYTEKTQRPVAPWRK